MSKHKFIYFNKKKILFYNNILIMKMNCEIILLVLLIAVIITVIVCIYKNMIIQNNEINKRSLLNVNSITDSPSIEGFKNNDNLKKENVELKKYLKIHGLYPQSAGMDMSKYVLKSSVKPGRVCPDMSQYVIKSSIPPPTKCPVINRDDWVRKSELPPNWNKECPAHPDLTNYVLKSTIPPTQKCPSCICPKIKVNAGLCRQPTKEDCLKTGILEEACPKPKPCPIPKCPEPKPCPAPPKCPEPKECPPPPKCREPEPCPEPPKLVCPKVEVPKCPEVKCPVVPKQGKCPEPQRCPPVKDCPKCYDVKYMKVPVVKSEPLPKPEQETILPTNIIDTKLIRQHMDEQPRQPRIFSIREQMNQNNNRNDNNRNNNNNNNNADEELPPRKIEIAPPPIASEQIFNNILYAEAPTISKEQPTQRRPKRVRAPPRLVNTKNNNNESKNNNSNNNDKATCNKGLLNNAYNKYGIRGFNNML